jgi:hypothetical protein
MTADLQAMAAYLKSLPPTRNQVSSFAAEQRRPPRR